MKSLKICHLTESFLPKVGGMQIIIDNLAREQAALGHQVSVVCPRYRRLSGPKPTPGYKVIRCFGSNRPEFALGAISWIRLALRERFDVIHAHNAWPGGTLGALAARLSGAKLVVTSHGRDIAKEPSIGYGSRLNPVTDFIIHRSLALADKHTVVRRSMVATAQDAGSRLENIAVVPNFAPSMVDADGEPRRVEKYLLAVGRLHPAKGFDLAIKAMKEISKVMPDLKLFIAGDGSESSELKRLSTDLGVAGSIDFIGQVTGAKKTAMIRDAWALLVTSRIEAFPIAPLEAMTLGIPVLAPKKEPFVEFIDATNGFLIDPERPETIIEALQALDDKAIYQQVSRRAKETAAKFSSSAAVSLYQDIYEDVMCENKSLRSQPA